jgi:putative tricarboxylic transport membrane protein
MVVFGVVGYLMRKFKYEGAPLVMAFVLGPLLEQALRRSLIVSGGSFSIFITRPISAVTLFIAFALLLSSFLTNIRARKPTSEEVI